MTNLRVGWKLEPEQRERLLLRFPPAFPDIDADHVTLGYHPTLPDDVEARVIGYASDGFGLEALVVAIDQSHNRPDGSIYHITWSLDKAGGRRASESNELLKQKAFIPLAKPIKIRVRPSVL